MGQSKQSFADIEPDWDNPIIGDARVPIDENTGAADNDFTNRYVKKYNCQIWILAMRTLI